MADSFTDVSDVSVRELVVGFVQQIQSGKPASVIAMVARSRLPGNEKLIERMLKAAGASPASASPTATHEGGGGLKSVPSIGKQKTKKSASPTTNAENANTNTNPINPNTNTAPANVENSENTALIVVKKKKCKSKKPSTDLTNTQHPNNANNPHIDASSSNSGAAAALAVRPSATSIDALVAQKPKSRWFSRSNEPASQSTTVAVSTVPKPSRGQVQPVDRMSSVDILEQQTPAQRKKLEKQTTKILAEEQKRLQRAAKNGPQREPEPEELMFGDEFNPIETDGPKKQASGCIVS